MAERVDDDRRGKGVVMKSCGDFMNNYNRFPDPFLLFEFKRALVSFEVIIFVDSGVWAILFGLP
jgi:hypothetical protein